ncbi:MAG: TetR/AcrR family transcriptional regulator [Cyanobacteria bacterium]|nr:TetR/AcrR family transcriptional regulator [Cyanobacteriota bacterium]
MSKPKLNPEKRSHKRGNVTRQLIIDKTAVLLNQKGYAALTMDDILEATGLKKGALYNHFKDKEALCCEAHRYACQMHARILSEYVQENLKKGKFGAKDKLIAHIDGFMALTQKPGVPGGCPLFNMAMQTAEIARLPELGSQIPLALRETVLSGLNHWSLSLQGIVSEGKMTQEIQASQSASNVSAIIISTLEGALIMTRLYQSWDPLETAAAHLKSWITSL